MADTKVPAPKGIPKLTLNDGTVIPMLGYGSGTALFKRSGDNDSVDRATVDAIKSAINAGFRHLDNAELYATEPEMGIAIKESGVPRQDFFITTKVFNTVNDIPKAIDQSLNRLQLEYVDLYLIHCPWWAGKDGKDPSTDGSDHKALQAAWHQMEKVKAAGFARSIGVSNYLVEHLQATLQTAKIPPSINQLEFHPYLQRSKVYDFAMKNKIATAAYGPLTTVAKEDARGGPVDEVVERLSGKYKHSGSVILLAWCIQRGVVAVTTSWKEVRMKDYLRVGDVVLTQGEVDEITEAGKQKHFRANNWQHEYGDSKD